MSLRLSGGRRLQSPPGERTRPTAARVRQAVFNLLAPELAGCRWLDLCCGSGVMACEALQRGAGQVVAVERDRRIAAVARANLAAVAGGLRRQDPPPAFEVVQAEVLSWLARFQPGASGAMGGRSSGTGAKGGAGAKGRAAGPEPSGVGDAGLDPGAGAEPGASGRAAAGEASGSSARARGRFALFYADPPWPDDLHGGIA
ncbi:MAG: RsmD family RNA methyltransferase, partial [Cyanobium sp.]